MYLPPGKMKQGRRREVGGAGDNGWADASTSDGKAVNPAEYLTGRDSRAEEK